MAERVELVSRKDLLIFVDPAAYPSINPFEGVVLRGFVGDKYDDKAVSIAELDVPPKHMLAFRLVEMLDQAFRVYDFECRAEIEFKDVALNIVDLEGRVSECPLANG